MSAKRTLLIDCGNTYLKWCLLDGENLTEQQSIKHKDASVLEVYKDLLDNQTQQCDSLVIVSVLGEVFIAGAQKLAEDAGLSFIEAHSQQKLGNITNGYHQVGNLGSDRMLAMIGAYQLVNKSGDGSDKNQQACIVIDSGTATTIDAVDKTGQHLGGVIFPGFELSLHSLSANTELLPKLDLTTQQNDEYFEANGLATDTPQAIASGCLLSLASAIDGICNKMQRQLEARSNTKSPVKRVLCGGVAKTILPYLENDYDYRENLIMLGLKKVKETESNND